MSFAIATSVPVTQKQMYMKARKKTLGLASCFETTTKLPLIASVPKKYSNDKP